MNFNQRVQLTQAELSLLQGLSYAVVQWQKGTFCSHLIRCLLLIITLEPTWKLQEVILLLTSYSLLVNCSLHNSLEQSTHSNTHKEEFVPWVKAEEKYWTAAKCSNETVKRTGAGAHGKREPHLKLCWDRSVKIAVSAACFVSPGVSTETLYSARSSSSCCLIFSRDHHFPSTSTIFLRRWKYYS